MAALRLAFFGTCIMRTAAGLPPEKGDKLLAHLVTLHGVPPIDCCRIIREALLTS